LNNDRTHQVSLGCGTLILIALIVMIFSGRGNDDLERDVERLRGDVQALKQAVDAQTESLRQLDQKLERLGPDDDAAGAGDGP
jgi:hypothetical protein